MKKYLILFLAAFLVANYSFAQYKPQKGSVSTEVQFNPFDQKGNTFQLDGVKVRYFFTDNDAFRLKLGFGMKRASFTENAGEKEEGDNSHSTYYTTESKYRSTTGNVELNLGYEHHFNVAKRVSAYIGASAGFNRYFALTKVDMTEYRHSYDNNRWRKEASSYATVKITNGAFTALPSEDLGDNPLDKVDDRAYWQVKAAVFAGLDFYVYKGLYLGTELGLGLDTAKSSKMTYQISNSADRENTTFQTDDKVWNTDLGFFIEPVLRLGWTF